MSIQTRLTPVVGIFAAVYQRAPLAPAERYILYRSKMYLSVLLVSIVAVCCLLIVVQPLQGATGNTLALPDVTVAPGQTVTVTLAYTHTQGAVTSADLRITYNPTVVTALSVQRGSLTTGWSIATNLNTPGVIQVALATGSTPLATSGDLLIITFQAANQAGSTALTLAQGSLNEGALAVTLFDGTITVNTPPVAQNDSYTVDEDQVLTVAAPGVLGNDSDSDSHSLNAALTSGTSSGLLTLQPTGAFIYTPTQNFAGFDHFTYAVNDGHGGSSSATVTIAISSINDPPVAVIGGPYQAGEGSTISLNGGQSSDIDHAASALTYEWDLDGDTVFETTGITPTFSAAALDGPTTAPIALRIRDPLGALSSVSTTAIAILNVAPTANPGGPYLVVADSTIQLDGTGSTDPAGSADPLTYDWDLNGDGSFETTGTTPLFDATGISAQDIVIALQVFDDDNGQSTVVTTTVRVTAQPLYTITGHVHYWNASRPLVNTTLALQGPQPINTTSLADGAFVIADVPGAAYTLIAEKTDDGQSITAYDAALVLRHVSGVSPLQGSALQAADVNTQGGPSALDASLILQRAVGLLDLPFAGAPAVWLFAPPSRPYTPLTADQRNQDFTGLLFGDVSGNWGANMTATSVAAASVTSDQVIIESGKVDASGHFTTFVKLNPAAGLIASDLDIRYDPQSVVVTAVTVHKPQADWLILSNASQPGLLRLALAGLQPIARELLIATITGVVTPGVTTPVFQVERLLVNEQEPGVATGCAAVACTYLSLVVR